MPGGYNLRSSQSVPDCNLENVSPIRIEYDGELNTTMMEPEPSIRNQLSDVIANLQNLTRVVIESRAEIDCLKQHIQVSSRTNLNEVRRSEIQESNVLPLAGQSHPQIVPSVSNLDSCSPGCLPFVPISGEEPHAPTDFSNRISLASSCKLYDLPAFSGNADEWPLFIANFKDTTDAFKYSCRQNLMRLQKCLFGPAKEAVSSMLIYPNDVPQVIEELEFRFGRPDILVRSQIQKVQQFSVISHKKMDQIIVFSTKVRNVVAFLTSAGCSHHLSNTTLLEEMVSKLPIDHQFEWAKVACSIKPFPTIVEFSKWLSDLAKVISLMPNMSPQQILPVKQMMVIDNKKPKMKCDVCYEDHIIFNCKYFAELPVTSRWEKTKQLKLCFCCLHRGHGSKGCRYRKVCGINNCKLYHHKTLHEDKAVEVPNTTKQLLNCRQQQLQASNLFKILPVKLSGPSGFVKAYAMFDEGSSISLIEENTARLLGLRGKSSDLNLQWYGDKTVKEKSYHVNFEIEGVYQQTTKFPLKKVHTVQKLNLPCQSFSKACYPHLSELPIEDYLNVKPILLIGLDNAFLGTPSAIKESGNSEIIAMNCKLGWFAYGSTNQSPQPTVLHIKDDQLSELVQNFIATENFGVNPHIKPLLSDEDQVAKVIMEETTKRVGKCFEIGLLWKKYPPDIPSSLEMAEKRLMTIERKMLNDTQYAEKYNAEIQKYVQKGYARKLTDEEVAQTSYPVWYLPHFGVVTPHKPNKLRVVFDAAAKTSGTSLNSLLLKGPEQAKPLLGILLKFRIGVIGVAADIREMFSQVRIRESDQHAQRFLWRNGNINEPLQHYVMVSMTFGAICSPCCAEFIKNYNAIEFSHKYPEAASEIIEKHYVDDFVSSFQNEDKAILTCQQVVEIHSEGSFELRGFVSNSKKLEDTLNGTETVLSEKVNMEKQPTTEKILGMYWNKSEDVFEFQNKFYCLTKEVLEGIRVPTKRELLKIAMAVFDPYGLIADILLYSKVLVQKTWKQHLAWDDPIPNELHKKWRLWWNEFKNVKNFKVPRCLSPNLFGSDIQLHIFVDASQDAFAAVCYFRIQHANGVDVSFVFGKIRCAPLKLMSIPRLELQAAVLGSRLSQTVVQNHDLLISSIFFLQWKYVPTHRNPADVGTRAIYPPNFTKNSVWVSGPKFLLDDESHWPNKQFEVTKSLIEEEIKPALLITTSNSNKLIDFSRFSSYVKLKRTLVWILRFAKRIPNTFDNIHPKDIDTADKLICKMVQAECFSNEVHCLKNKIPISKNSPMYPLVPYMDSEGLLRIQGRLDEAQYLPFEARRPIILPQNHWVSELIMKFYHMKNHHQNMSLTINELRQRYWLPHAKSVFNRIKRNCLICRFDSIQPNRPLMGQLPPDRVTPYVRPFTYTGVDLFGPFNVSIGRRREKRWVVIFTCLTIRASHLELADDLSTGAFILCFKNFINRRGTPKRMRSDNGTNFIGAQKLLNKEDQLFDTNQLYQEAAKLNIEWLFNCPANPSSGGVWERLIQIVKRLLRKTLKDTSPKVETLRSLLIEAENILNSRPLTEIPIKSNDDEPLTPNHFLLGCLNSTQTPSNFDENVCLRKQWKILQNLKNRLWKRWVTEYLPQLLQMTKWKEKSKPIKVDDIVLILDSTLPRSQWLKGRIVKLFPAKDGQIRFAEVKTTKGITRRPVSKLAVLTIDDCESG